jgi:hypothetical protein
MIGPMRLYRSEVKVNMTTLSSEARDDSCSRGVSSTRYRNAARRIVLACSLLILLSFTALTSGCSRDICVGVAACGVEDGYRGKNTRMRNARIEAPLQSFQQPGLAYWLKRESQANGQLVVKWDTFETLWEQEGATCDFSQIFSSTQQCQVCDYCEHQSGTQGAPCFSASPPVVGAVLPMVQVYEGFMHDSTPKTILSYGGNGDELIRGCARNGNMLLFQPETDGTYQHFFPRTPAGDAATEMKVFVVQGGTSRTVAYQLKEPSVVDGRTYWKREMEDVTVKREGMSDETKWRETFSPNLHVTNIRILKGKCETDPKNDQCVITGPATPVKPSRILFLPTFQNTVDLHLSQVTHRCYSTSTADDKGSYISLDQCRDRADATQTSPRLVTPTYDQAQQLERLTWLVEFDVNETLPSNGDMINATESLIIEFTIQ